MVSLKPTNRIAFVFGMAPWAPYLDLWLDEYKIVQFSRRLKLIYFLVFVAPRLWLARSRAIVAVWGFQHPMFVENFSRLCAIPVVRLEDGFVRSVGLGSSRSPPRSICIDQLGIHYDPSHTSELEQLLLTYEFRSDVELMQRASSGMKRMLLNGISKYNPQQLNYSLYGPKRRPRILVLGQVPSDMSIKKGCNADTRMSHLVELAARENSDADIYFKPHPAELKHIDLVRDPEWRSIASKAEIIREFVPLAAAFETIDRVYTFTSLGGFEALLRRIPVTCVGTPFYAGWGLTDDRQQCSRRSRKLQIEEVFAAAYIIYPRYFDYRERRLCTFEEVLNDFENNSIR